MPSRVRALGYLWLLGFSIVFRSSQTVTSVSVLTFITHATNVTSYIICIISRKSNLHARQFLCCNT
jgi:hypothetical protein